MVKKYRIRAWGSADHPDLDYEADEIDQARLAPYPFRTIAQQNVVLWDTTLRVTQW